MLKYFKTKSKKLTPFCIDDKLLEKYKTIWTIEDLKNIHLNVLPVYDNRYIKTKRITYVDKIYTNFRGLNMPEDGVESVNTQMKDYLDDDLFDSDKN